MQKVNTFKSLKQLKNFLVNTNGKPINLNGLNIQYVDFDISNDCYVWVKFNEKKEWLPILLCLIQISK